MEILILLLLIIINGFFSLSEISLVSSKKNRLENLSNKGSKGARKALQLLEKSENFLSAIQIGITLIGIITGVYGGMSLAEYFVPFFTQFSWAQEYAESLALFITVAIITYVSIVLGELVPKTIAMSSPETIAKRVARPISFFTFVFYPIVRLLGVSTNLINKGLGVKKNSDSLTESELRHLLKSASNEGIIGRDQNKIHQKVFNFSDKKAKHIMTHRTEIEWIDINEKIDFVKEKMLNLNHSYIVCADGDLDHFVGIMSQKDFYRALLAGKEIKINSLISQPILIPEMAVASQILDILRYERGKMCFIINEYGGFEGIITLHDVLENIIGFVPEEWESNESMIKVRDDQTILLDGDAPIEVLAELIPDFEIDFDTINFSTVAGYVISKMSHFPHTGDKINLSSFTIEIVDMDGHRIDKILLQLTHNQ